MNVTTKTATEPFLQVAEVWVPEGLPEGHSAFVGLPIHRGGGLSHIVASYI